MTLDDRGLGSAPALPYIARYRSASRKLPDRHDQSTFQSLHTYSPSSRGHDLLTIYFLHTTPTIHTTCRSTSNHAARILNQSLDVRLASSGASGVMSSSRNGKNVRSNSYDQILKNLIASTAAV